MSPIEDLNVIIDTAVGPTHDLYTREHRLNFYNAQREWDWMLQEIDKNLRERYGIRPNGADVSIVQPRMPLLADFRNAYRRILLLRPQTIEECLASTEDMMCTAKTIRDLHDIVPMGYLPEKTPTR